MHRRYAIVSVAVPVAVGAIIAAYGIRHHGGQHRTSIDDPTTSVVGASTDPAFARIPSAPTLFPTGVRIQTEAQASSRALEVAYAFGADHPRVVNIEMLTLEAAITRTQRAFEDEIDLGAAGYGESSRSLPAWRVQLENAAFGTGIASTAMLPTAILVLAAAGGTLIDMTLAYPASQ